MVSSAFDYLTGTIGVDRDAPAAWKTETELPFWLNPNDESWGDELSRVLYHETIHFWQLLSSGYVANLVGEEWGRLLEYEDTGELPEKSDLVAGHNRPAPGDPFSPRELVECWARYWDVHTRSPARIVREEGIPVDDPRQLEIEFSAVLPAYTGDAFDTVMQVGEDCALYGRPYRWLLETVDGHSALAAILFPVVAHAAFGSPDPVALFRRAVERALGSDEIRAGIDGRSGSINLDWLNSWTAVHGEAVRPAIADLGLPSFTSGLDVISRGPLSTHPVLSEYPERASIRGWIRLTDPGEVPGDPYGDIQAYALTDAPERDPMVVFGLPGQPYYRAGLGRLVPPPRIRFRNYTWYAPRSGVRTIQEAFEGTGTGDEDYGPRYPALDRRIDRFEAAKKAVSLGLPPDHFERAGAAA